MACKEVLPVSTGARSPRSYGIRRTIGPGDRISDGSSNKHLLKNCTWYCMTKGFMAIFVIMMALLVSMGCLSPAPPPAAPPAPTPSPTTIPTPESPVSTIQPSAMALQLSDIPSDYLLKDRSDAVYAEQSPISQGLGWEEGYSVTFYRINLEKYDLTGLRQTIDVYRSGT